MNDQVETTPVDSGSQEAAPVGFLDSLPEELRHEPSLKNFTDSAGLAKSYVHAQRMVGADRLHCPDLAPMMMTGCRSFKSLARQLMLMVTIAECRAGRSHASIIQRDGCV
jgi:hypothetical protein